MPGPFVTNIPDELGEAADLVTPVLRKVLDFMGVRDFDVGRAGGSLAVNLGKVWLEDHLEKYGAEIAAAARVWWSARVWREADAAVKFAARLGVESLRGNEA